MANKIQIRRGVKTKIPIAAVGEPLFTTDTHEFFIGTGSGNVNMGGGHWYNGTAMTGTTSTANYYSYSACPLVKLEDMYLNTSNGYIYECTTAGSGSNAKWTYRGCLKGATGSTGSTGSAGANGKDGAKGERGANATIVIAASNSSTKSKAAADYTCSGSGDQSTITTALNALPLTGGKIVFLEGTYSISSAFTISKNVVFEGMGDGTVLNVSGSLATCSAAVNVVFRDMKITANTISKYLYKGGGSDNVLLDNVTLTMIATGVHNLTTTDTKAAFMNSKLFTAVNSRMSVKATSSIHPSGSPGCFAVAELSNISSSSESVKFNGCDITLDGTYGRIHAARYNMNLSNSTISLIKGSASKNSAILSDTTNMIVNCDIHISGSDSGTDSVGYCGIANSRVYNGSSGSEYVYHAVGCLFHNVKLSGNDNIGNTTY